MELNINKNIQMPYTAEYEITELQLILKTFVSVNISNYRLSYIHGTN